MRDRGVYENVYTIRRMNSEDGGEVSGFERERGGRRGEERHTLRYKYGCSD